MMQNFFAKKGLSFSRNHEPSSHLTHDQRFVQPERYLHNISQPTQSTPYGKPGNQSSWAPSSQLNNHSFTTTRSPEPSQYSYTSHNDSYVSNPIKPNDFQYLQVPNKNQQFPHKRNGSEYSNSRSQFSHQEFKEMQAQFPSVSTEDKTPKNINNVEQNRSMSHIPLDKHDQNKYNSLGNIEVKTRPTNIKQIKEQLLNQGRKDKDGSLRQDRSRKDFSSSNKYLGVSEVSVAGSSNDIPKPRAISSITNPMATSNVTSVTASKTNLVTSSNVTEPINTYTNKTTYSAQKVESNVKTSNTGASSSYWIEEKMKLLKQMEEKDNKIAELEKKLSTSEQQNRTKKVIFQSEKRKLEGSKNRAEIQLDNVKKLLQMERAKSDEARTQMDKMMFFEDDLIHAKDYTRIKRQLEDVLRQNAQMYQEHQKYILEVAQTRRQLTNRLEELEVELNKYRLQAAEWHGKIEGLNSVSEDKVQLIKLQHDVNFILKKSEENMEELMKKEEKLEQAHMHIKMLKEQENRRQDSHKNLLNGLSMQQLTQTIARYESRVEDMNDILQSKNFQIDKQKRTIQCLASQMRKSREDKMICSMKERSHENSLKNQLTTMQQSLKGQIDLQAKKISNLEDKFNRKVKEVGEKDKFIKDFLLNRVKDIESHSFEELIKIIRNYFTPEEQLKDSKESKTTGKDQNQAQEEEVRQVADTLAENSTKSDELKKVEKNEEKDEEKSQEAVQQIKEMPVEPIREEEPTLSEQNNPFEQPSNGQLHSSVEEAKSDFYEDLAEEQPKEELEEVLAVSIEDHPESQGQGQRTEEPKINEEKAPLLDQSSFEDAVEDPSLSLPKAEGQGSGTN